MIAKKHSNIWLLGSSIGLLVAGCNSRPHYFNEVYDIASDCVADAAVRVVHDSDPDELKAFVETTNVAAESGYEHGRGLFVKFDDGPTCFFKSSEKNGECFEGENLQQASRCAATRKLVELRKPTHSDPRGTEIPHINPETF